MLVQGNNNNITISSPCSPTKRLQVADVSQPGTTPGETSTSGLQFTIRAFIIDARNQTIYLDMASVNHSADAALVQFVTAVSSIQLSDPPASVPLAAVEGLSSCPYNSRNCLARAEDTDSTSIPAGGILGFRLTARVGGRIDLSSVTSGSVSLEFVRRVGNKYQKLDLSFLDVNARQSR